MSQLEPGMIFLFMEVNKFKRSIILYAIIYEVKRLRSANLNIFKGPWGKW